MRKESRKVIGLLQTYRVKLRTSGHGQFNRYDVIGVVGMHAYTCLFVLFLARYRVFVLCVRLRVCARVEHACVRDMSA